MGKNVKLNVNIFSVAISVIVALVLIGAAIGTVILVKHQNDDKKSAPSSSTTKPATKTLQIPEANLAFDYPTTWGQPQVNFSNVGYLYVVFGNLPSVQIFISSNYLPLVGRAISSQHCTSFEMINNSPEEVCTYISDAGEKTKVNNKYPSYGFVQTSVGPAVLSTEPSSKKLRQIEINIVGKYTGMSAVMSDNNVENSVVDAIKTLKYMSKE